MSTCNTPDITKTKVTSTTQHALIQELGNSTRYPVLEQPTSTLGTGYSQMVIRGNITQTNVASELMHHHLTQRLSLEMDLPLSSPIQEDQKHPHTTALNAQLQNRKCRTEHQSGQHLDHLVKTGTSSAEQKRKTSIWSTLGSSSYKQHSVTPLCLRIHREQKSITYTPPIYSRMLPHHTYKIYMCLIQSTLFYTPSTFPSMHLSHLLHIGHTLRKYNQLPIRITMCSCPLERAAGFIIHIMPVYTNSHHMVVQAHPFLNSRALNLKVQASQPRKCKLQQRIV